MKYSKTILKYFCGLTEVLTSQKFTSRKFLFISYLHNNLEYYEKQ